MTHIRKIAVLGTVIIALAGCGGGGGSAAPVPVAPAPPPTALSPDLTQAKLLTDAELATLDITPVPQVLPAYRDWIAANNNSIRSITYDQDFSDLGFLKPLVGERKIVQLGESSHGTKEFNHVKTRLIKFLHQEMGFSVVAFESGFFEGYYTDINKASWTADQLMGYIFGVWSTNEVFDLFRYIQNTQATPNPLSIMGFDIQISSPSYYSQIQNFILSTSTTPQLESALKDDINNRIQSFRSLQTTYRQQSCFSSQSSACADVISQGETVRSFLLNHKQTIGGMENLTRDEKAIYILILAAIGQIDNSTATYRDRDIGDVRDQGMADVFKSVQAELFPDEKIIIWAHNRHIAKEQSETLPINAIRNYPVKPMGYHLHQAYTDDLFTIGLYMLRGETAGNDRTPYGVVVPKDNSLEAIAHSVRKAAFYLNTSPLQTQEPGNKFLFDRSEAHYWGGQFGSYSMVPVDQYDGIIFIDSSSTPSYRQ